MGAPKLNDWDPYTQCYQRVLSAVADLLVIIHRRGICFWSHVFVALFVCLQDDMKTIARIVVKLNFQNRLANAHQSSRDFFAKLCQNRDNWKKMQRLTVE